MADGDGRAIADAGRGGLAGGAARRGVRRQARCRTIVQRRAPIYDKGQDGHYNLISALHKSVRGSDPDAALYYLCPHARRRRGPALSRPPAGAHGDRRISASPIRRRWSIANAAKDAYDYLGSPEGELALGRGDRLSRHRAEIERRLHRLQGRRCGRPRRTARCCRPSTSSTRRPS